MILTGVLLSATFPLAAFAQATSGPAATSRTLVAQAEAPNTQPAPGDEATSSDSGEGLLDRAKKAVQDAGRNVGEAATATGRSAADYLSDNPDLGKQVLDFGKKVGVPGFETTADGGAQLTVTRTDAGQLQVLAYGLPAAKDVNLGWLDGEQFRAVQTLTADRNGRIDTTIETPSALARDQETTLAIETLDRRLRLASDPIKPL